MDKRLREALPTVFAVIILLLAILLHMQNMRISRLEDRVSGLSEANAALTADSAGSETGPEDGIYISPGDAQQFLKAWQETTETGSAPRQPERVYVPVPVRNDTGDGDDDDDDYYEDSIWDTDKFDREPYMRWR